MLKCVYLGEYLYVMCVCVCVCVCVRVIVLNCKRVFVYACVLCVYRISVFLSEYICCAYVCVVCLCGDCVYKCTCV